MSDEFDKAAPGVPYPLGHGEVGITTQNGTPVRIRHVTAGDAPLLVEFNRSLSPQTRWLRFFTPVGIPEERLWGEATRQSDIDRLVEASLIATVERDGQAEAVAVARLVRERPWADSAEVAIVVRDDFQREGIGRTIFDLLVQVALVQGIKRLIAVTLPENTGMQRLARGVGLPTTSQLHAGDLTITMHLDGAR